ncbi:MAG: V-type ATPase subunit, partial [Nanoarchaeota archaeon]
MKLPFNAYTFVRVSVMRSTLLKPEEYKKMLKMSFAEIAEALRQSNYKQEIEHLGLRLSGAALLEHALNENLKKTYEKLLRVSDENMQKVINAYLLRNDFHNVKTILRSKVTSLSEQEMKDLFLPGTISNIDALMKKDTISDVLKSSNLVSPDFLKQAKKVENNLIKLENLLDKEYFLRMKDFAATLENGKVMKEF